MSPFAAQTQPTAARATIAATRDGEADAAGTIAWRHRAVEWLRRDGSACARPKNDFDALGSGVRIVEFHLPFYRRQCDIYHPMNAEYLDQFEACSGCQATSEQFPKSVGAYGNFPGSRNKHCLTLEQADQSVDVALIERILVYLHGLF